MSKITLLKKNTGKFLFGWVRRKFSKKQPIYEFPWEENKNWRLINLKFHAPFEYILLIDNFRETSFAANKAFLLFDGIFIIKSFIFNLGVGKKL